MIEEFVSLQERSRRYRERKRLQEAETPEPEQSDKSEPLQPDKSYQESYPDLPDPLKKTKYQVWQTSLGRGRLRRPKPKQGKAGEAE